MNPDQESVRQNTIRVLVASNSRIYTRLLADALMRDPLLNVIPFEADSTDLVNTAMQEDIDVLLVGSTLDEQSGRGIELLHQLRVSYPKTRSVLLSNSSKDGAVLQAFRAGARGIFGPDQPMELLSKCVRCVYQGEVFASNHDFGIAVDGLANSPTVRAVNADGMSLLSEREMQVVECLAEGLTNREIANRLHLSQHTVKNYLFKIFDKVGVSSRVELLFMSLSQASEQSSGERPSVDVANGGSSSRYESDLLKKSAEAGIPAAQLALAQLYLSRRSNPADMVEAYTWYLIATECAMQARGFITKMLTAEQMEEAEGKASNWLARRKQGSTSGNGSRPSKRPSPSGAETFLSAGD